jgi:hypothetical protein
VGNEVIGFSNRRSSHAEYVTVPADQLTPRPAAVPWEVAGSLFVAGATAYAAVRAMRLVPGDTVAIAGAAGGVGSIAVQLARRAGATLLGIAGPSNDAWLADHGAVPVNYGDELPARLRAAARSEKVDALLDFFGGGYVAMAVEDLGIPRDRVDTITDFAAVERFGVQSAGGADAATAAVLAELADLVARGELDVPITGVRPRRRAGRVPGARTAPHPRQVGAATVNAPQRVPWAWAASFSASATPTADVRLGTSRKYQLMTSRAGPACGVAQSRKSSVTTASAVLGTRVRQPLDRRPVRDLGSATDCVGDDHRVVSVPQRLDRREVEADLGMQLADDRPPAPVRSTASRNATSSNAFIEVRSMGSRPSSSARIPGSVGPLKPYATPTVDNTIGISNALAALASNRTLRFNQVGVRLRADDLEHLLLVVDQHQRAVVEGPDTQVTRHSDLLRQGGQRRRGRRAHRAERGSRCPTGSSRNA